MELNYYKVKIAYKGTKFSGWQAQSVDSTTEESPTIQGSIQRALYKIARSKNCIVSGTSRTDTGVHARSQYARISLPISIDPNKLLLGLNTELHEDIRILECENCDRTYAPSTYAVEKEYHYYFSNEKVVDPVIRDFVSHFSLNMDIQQMKKAAKLFVGTFDFYNFYLRSSAAVSTVRTIKECEIQEVDFGLLGSKVYCLKIRGDGFLKQMIRIIVQSLYLNAQGKLSEEDIKKALVSREDSSFTRSAGARGLHLVDIKFEKYNYKKKNKAEVNCEI